MKINILDSSVYNRISAGEVVENPASVVKELVENAIDAGATAISVRIEDGGIKYIEVTDNGCGIERDELPKAILAHATSKIEQAEDLNIISTLGFRGEALASVAAVSDFEILTLAAGEDCGSLLKAKDGVVTVSDAACSAGTSVRVRNLFYNTPARYKFLSSKTTEESYISRYIFQFILSNPDIAIDYRADGEPVYTSSGTGMASAVESVFIPKIADNLIELIPSRNTAGIDVSGYISAPCVFKNNRTQQTVVLNGRIVYDQTISATVQNAYGERLMNRCFPIFVLNIIMPFDEVDVNVHPNKKEVRFGNPRKVYSAIYHTVKQALERYEGDLREELTSGLVQGSSVSFSVDSTAEKRNKVTSDNEKQACAVERCGNIEFTGGNTPSRPGMSLGEALELVRGSRDKYPDKVSFKEPCEVSVDTNGVRYDSAIVSDVALNKVVTGVTSPSLSEQESFFGKSVNVGDVKTYRVVGQLFATYLVIECGDKVLFIDQHAMHERILFDAFMQELASSEVAVQPLMIPYIYEADAHTVAVLLSNKDLMTESGFEIEAFGKNSVKISSVPAALGNVDLGVMLTEISEALVSGKNSVSDRLGRDRLATAACKAAINGGDAMSDEQIKLVMDYFAAGNMPLQCPHGRPTAIVYSRYEFEKLFRRKV